MKAILMKVLPHVVAVIAFLVIGSTFFSLLGDEYRLRQHDIQHVMGMSKELSEYRLMNGEEALWSNNMFGGMPGYQTNVQYPSNLLRPLDQFLKLYQSPTTGAMFMLMLGFYILMLCLRVNPWLGIVAAVSFGLSSFNVIYLGSGHTSKINALAYMAPTLGALILAYRGKWLLGGALFCLFFGLHLAANHLQMTYYLAFLLGAVALTEIIRLSVAKQIRQALLSTGMLAVAAVVGFLPNAGSVLATYEYSKYTTRGKSELTIVPEGKEESAQAADGLRDDYILEYNMAAGEPWAMIIPNAKGGSSSVALIENKDAIREIPKQYREDVASVFRQYWGEQGSSAGAFYFGAGIFFLFVLALICYKDWLRWPFLVLTILAIFLSMRDMHGLNDFFIHKFPFYNKFRDTKMIHVLIQIMVPAFAFMFADHLLKNGVDKTLRKWLLAGSGAIVLVLLLVMANPSVTGPLLSEYDEQRIEQFKSQYASNPEAIKTINEFEPSLIAAREYIFRKDAQRSLLMVLAFAGLVVAVSFNKLKWYLFAAISGVVATADMWSVSSRYINDEKVRNQETDKMEYRHYEKIADVAFPYAPDKSDFFILEKEKGQVKDFDAQVAILREKLKKSPTYKGISDEEKFDFAAEFGVLQLNTDYRVMSPTMQMFSEAALPYFHKSLGGYHAAKLKRYQEMIDFHLGPEIRRIAESFSSGDFKVIDSTIATCNAINMLNTRYIKFNADREPIDNSANALGNAWFVSDVKMAENADEEMLAVGEINPRNTAVVHKEFASALKQPEMRDSSASIQLTEYKTKKLIYQSSNPNDGLAVFSEIYYPAGWVCRIDGQEADVLRANYLLRAVNIPAGNHQIEWSFEPKIYTQATTINWIGSVLFLLFAFGVMGWNLRDAFRTAK